jgi:hypothetical protein
MQDLEHITVTHFGPNKLYAALLQSHFDGQVGHQGAHSARHGFIAGQAVGDHQVQEFIAIEQTARCIDQ